MAKQTYTAFYNKAILPAGTYQSNIQINSPNRQITIRRITITWKGITNTGNVTPWRISTSQEIDIKINSLSGFDQLGQGFKVIANAPNINGYQLSFFEPGQWEFDKFVIKNGLDILITLQNRGAVDSVTHSLTFIIETEEIPL